MVLELWDSSGGKLNQKILGTASQILSTPDGDKIKKVAVFGGRKLLIEVITDEISLIKTAASPSS